MGAVVDGTVGPRGRKISTLVIANRHEIASAGIEALLHVAGHRVVARCSREDDLLRSLEAYRPNITILAENIVGHAVTETVLRLRARCPVRIIFLLEERDAITTADLLHLQVEGILLSAACAGSLVECVASVHQGRKWIDPELLCQLAMAERADACSLTSREAEIGHRISRGLRNKEIARELHLSEGTVKLHVHHIYQKLHLRSRTQLVLSLAEPQTWMPSEARALESARRNSAAVARVVARRQPKNVT
jgi:two-component system, NarL family, nitrate/nitrite response regulator NarL